MKRVSRRRANARKRAWTRFYAYRFAEMTLCAVILISAVMLAGIAVRSVRTKLLNRSLSQRRAELSQLAAADEETPLPLDQMEEITQAQPAEVQPAQAQMTEAQPTQAQPTPAPVSTAAQPTSIPIVKSTKYHQVGGAALPHMEALYYENRDLIGWIEIPDVLDLPVMYRDNSYYLNRDFYKQSNTSGTIFLDVNHKFKESTQNLLLHGHNMKDGTMFGRLAQYSQGIDYLKSHPFVRYDTLWEEGEYVIFAVLHVSLDIKSERFFNYFSYPTFKTDAAFETYARELQLRSMYAIPIDVQPSDALLTLSTCLEDDRLVIVCRRVREGESRSELKRLINLAAWQ